MKKMILWHAAAHPSMRAQDAIKLCYQAAFGAEHLLTDAEKVRAYFEREWDNVLPKDVPLWEPISERYGRVNIAAWKRRNLPREWLFRMFYLTASSPSDATCADLNEYLATVAEAAESNQMPFTAAEWKEMLSVYERYGGGPVHHSEQYRNAECPSYRVVDRHYIELIHLLSRIAEIQPKQGPITIAIDGRAASGKTTLAQKLSGILEAGVVHMDDFFLPPALRTPERLAEAGGNVHYERFAEQVIPHLKDNGTFDYPVFNCSKMQLDGFRSVPAGQWRVVEGSYSHHPRFSEYMDLRVFCQISPDEQMRRILVRNGQQMAQMFAERWIPMEEHYFKTYHIAEQADIIINTEEKEHETDI